MQPLHRGGEENPEEERRSHAVHDHGGNVGPRQRPPGGGIDKAEDFVEVEVDVRRAAERDVQADIDDAKEHHPADDGDPREPVFGAVDAALEAEQVPDPVHDHLRTAGFAVRILVALEGLSVRVGRNLPLKRGGSALPMALAAENQSLSSSLMLVLERVRSSTRLMMTAQAVEGPTCPFFIGLPGSAPGTTTAYSGTSPMKTSPLSRSTILVVALRNTPIASTAPRRTITPSTTSLRAPMKQSSSTITGSACSGSSTPPIPTPPEICTRLPIWAQEPTVDQVSTMVASST